MRQAVVRRQTRSNGALAGCSGAVDGDDGGLAGGERHDAPRMMLGVISQALVQPRRHRSIRFAPIAE
ncbi:hypothetical protein D3C71_1729730 [compost metagenome]